MSNLKANIMVAKLKTEKWSYVDVVFAKNKNKNKTKPNMIHTFTLNKWIGITEHILNFYVI